MSTLQFKILNFVVFQLIWISAVVFQYQGLWACILLIALHFFFSPQRLDDLKLCYKAIMLGMVVDLLLMLSGVYIFPVDYFPLWLICLWVGFTLTLRHSLKWISEKPLPWQVALGAVGGTLSYVSGAHLGAVSIGIDFTYAVILLLLIWGALFPTLLRIVNREPHEKLA